MDNPETPDDLEPEEVKKLSGLVPDIVRRAVLTGVGALFMTEEGLRNLVGEMKLPKDALGFLLAQADKTRTEVARVVTQEMRRFLESDRLRREIWKLLTSVSIEINATVNLKPSAQPQFKARLRQRKEAPRKPPEEPEQTLPVLLEEIRADRHGDGRS
jgi:hypothetical protein